VPTTALFELDDLGQAVSMQPRASRRSSSRN